jgi:WD40 repeat protein
MTCYDLRFRLPAGSIYHPTRARVRRMVAYPVEGGSCHPSGSVVASFKGNNEVAVWNFETQSRQMTLWASPYPPLSLTQATHHSVCAICPNYGRDGVSWFLGGTDMRVRLWNTSNMKASMLCPAGNDTVPTSAFNYSARLMEGCEVAVEGLDDGSIVDDGSGSFPLSANTRHSGTSHSSTSSSTSFPSSPVPSTAYGTPPYSSSHRDVWSRAGATGGGEQDSPTAPMGSGGMSAPYAKLFCYAPPPVGHSDGISDIISVSSSQPALVTSSRDGVIKIWK